MPAETTDGGGGNSSSGSYSNDGSLGGVAGISTVSSPAGTAKAGYIGQLYEVTSLQLAASPATIDESGTRQLSAAQLLDDLTFINIPPSSVDWTIQAGPLTSIDANGLATAAAVYEDTAATVQGGFEGLLGQFALTVLNTFPDNFGSYAGDGLDDGWQNQYFGLDNPDAAPSLDPDGDGQDNFFEFTAGLVPTDAASRFLLRNASVAGQPAQQDVVFSPRFSDRTYTVESNSDLTGGSWNPLAVSSSSDDGEERTVTDENAGGARKFYRVEIAKP